MSSSSGDPTILVFKGKAMYAKVHYPDTMYDPKWVVDLLIDKDTIKIAEEHELRVKHKDKYSGLHEGYDGSYLQITRDTHKRTGEAVDPPRVVDKNTVDVGSEVQIGNGSDIRVRFIVKNRDPEIAKKWNGYGMYMTGVQILNLVPFERNSDPSTDFVKESTGSFKSNTANNEASDFDDNEVPFDATVSKGY